MRKIFSITILFLFILSSLSLAVERRKGVTWNEKLIFKQDVLSNSTVITDEGGLLLDYTVKTDTIYTATLNRSAATILEIELSNTEDFYVGWFWYFNGEIRFVTAYSPSIDGDGVVIGQFTLKSSFDTDPATGANARLIDPNAISESDQSVMRVSPANQIQIGGENAVAVIHKNPEYLPSVDDGFVKYNVTEDALRFFHIGIKPVKTTSINVTTVSTIFGTFFAFEDAFMTKIGIHLDSVPANTKARIYVLGEDEIDPRYPVLENVSLDEFSQGLGDDVFESTYADETTWNLLEMSVPTVLRIAENFNVVVSFSDENGDPRILDVPVDTSFTDSPQWFTVRSNDIQFVSGALITLDADASPRDDDYIGMRLYLNGEFRDITDYNGATKVATIASVYTVEPSPSDPYNIKIASLMVSIKTRFEINPGESITCTHFT